MNVARFYRNYFNSIVSIGFFSCTTYEKLRTKHLQKKITGQKLSFSHCSVDLNESRRPESFFFFFVNVSSRAIHMLK